MRGPPAMSTISYAVFCLRRILLSYDQTLKPHIPDLAMAYAAACVEVNSRLAQCQRLLQQGLRAEALHLAEEAPDLLETVLSLDFPERPLWNDIVSQYDLAVAPTFD